MPHPAPPRTEVATPREPEIEFLGKVVQFALLAFRAATVTAGAVALAYGVYGIANPQTVTYIDYIAVGPRLEPIAPYFVWLCVGIPPLLPTGWLFGRGRWAMLLVGLALWLGPHALDGDSDYGYLIRFFASLVAVSVLLVWRTVFALTRPHGEVSAPPM